MNRSLWPIGMLMCLATATGCNDSQPFARAFRITHRAQAIGGESALADLNDYVLENDRIRIALPQAGNSVGPGVFGGSLIDADLRRTDPNHRGGRGLDQFTELFPIGNLAVPAICAPDRGKIEGFCELADGALKPKVYILCGGSRPCRTCYGRSDCLANDGQIDLAEDLNQDYADPEDPERPGPAAPSEKAAVLRVEGMSGNYLEALELVALIGVKMHFRVRNDYILEPGARHVRIRTLLIETDRSGRVRNPTGAVAELPVIKKPTAVFGIMLGSESYPTELPGLQPGVAGGDFLFFGDRLRLFAPGIGFDAYRDIRNKFAVGQDPLNNPITADFLAGVGEHVSYAIGSFEPGGKYLLPILSGAVTAGFSHAAHCHPGPCPGDAEQCANVVDCSQIKGHVFERIFAVGEGDVASAARAIWEVRGVPTGRLRGRVIDSRDASPVTHAEVHVFKAPASMADCRPGGSAGEPYRGGPERFEAECLIPREYAGAFNHLRTDRGATDLPVGRFAGVLPVGSYYLLAKVPHRTASRVVPITIREGETSEVTLALQPPARLQIEVRDENNQRVPVKLTIGQCMPNCSLRVEDDCEQDGDCPAGRCVDTSSGERRCQVDNCAAGRVCNPDTLRCDALATCNNDGDCEPVERCVGGRCSCKPGFVRKAALGEGTFPPGLGIYVYAPHGVAEVDLEPDSYEVWASRGFEYSVDKQQVRAVSARAAQLAMRVRRVVDTAGWISGDFHVHGQNSYDGVVKHRDRVISFAGEGVELLSTSDHDYLTDLAPYVFELGLEKWVKTQVGLELTTVEIGHWLAFPLRYEEWRDGVRIREQGAVDWTGKVPDQLHQELRELGAYSPEETVVVIAHPRYSFFGYFDQYGLNHFDPSKVEGSLFEYLPGIHVNPVARPEYFSGTFDALELFNSKRYEWIRTPTAGEIRDYNQARSVTQAESTHGADPAVIERKLIALDQTFIKDILRRTPAEQDALWEADGSAGCDLMTFCTNEDDCDANEGEICDAASMTCYRPCVDQADCGGRACVAGKCDPGWTPAQMPCPAHKGVVDDWMRLIDYGVVRSGMGNSDTHQLFTQTEGGLPRNFIRHGAEQAKAIDLREINRAIKAGKLVASYGPFVEVWLGDAQIGDPPYSAVGRETVPLRIRVQSPEWFDVDRVEVYRSGRLIHVLTGTGDEMHPEAGFDFPGLRLPNSSTVNLDAIFDEPVPESDVWFVVIAMGLDGRDLSPVYTEHPYLELQIGDVLGRALAPVPLPFDVASVAIPQVFRVYPYAVANPVFLDTDGNGMYDAPHETPAWARGGLSPRARSSAPDGDGPLAGPTDASTLRARQLRRFLYLLRQAAEGGRREGR